MGAVAILIISIAGLTLLVIAVVSVISNFDKQNISVKKTNNNSFQKPNKSIFERLFKSTLYYDSQLISPPLSLLSVSSSSSILIF